MGRWAAAAGTDSACALLWSSMNQVPISDESQEYTPAAARPGDGVDGLLKSIKIRRVKRTEIMTNTALKRCMTGIS